MFYLHMFEYSTDMELGKKRVVPGSSRKRNVWEALDSRFSGLFGWNFILGSSEFTGLLLVLIECMKIAILNEIKLRKLSMLGVIPS